MIIVAYVLNVLLIFALPIGLAVYLTRHLAQPWRLIFIGGATFIASQVVHIPLNLLIDRLSKSGILPTPPEAWVPLTNAIILGLSAGLCEELARWLVYKYWIKDARHWRQGVVFGLGHGGTEAVLLVGVIAVLQLINVLVINQLSAADLAARGLTPDQITTAKDQIAQILNVPFWYPFLGVYERLCAIANHIAMAVLVLQAFRRRNNLWLLAAILWHAALDGVAVYIISTLGQQAGALWAEGAVTVFAVLSIGIIWLLREPWVPPAPAEPAEPLPLPVGGPLAPATPTAEKLDDSRYQ